LSISAKVTRLAVRRLACRPTATAELTTKALSRIGDAAEKYELLGVGLVPSALAKRDGLLPGASFGASVGRLEAGIRNTCAPQQHAAHMARAILRVVAVILPMIESCEQA